MNAPKLRFNEFSDSWESHTLGSLGEFKNGVNKSKEDFGHGLPFVNLMDVFAKDSLINKSFELVNVTEKELNTYNLVKGDVIFIRSSVKLDGVGQTAVVLENLNKTVYSGFLIRFRESENRLSLLYKKYCFSNKSFRNQVLSVCTTSANTNINQESLNQLTLITPSFPEQTKIANFLTAIDDKINQLSQKIELLTQYKNGVMQQIFSQKLRFKSDDGLEFGSWEMKKLGDVGAFTGGGTPSKGNSDYWQGDIPWVSSSDIYDDDVFNVAISRFITNEALKNSATKLVKKGSLLIVSRVGVGKFAVAPVDLCTSQDFTNLTLRIENNIFLAYLLSFSKQQLVDLSQGTSIKGFVKSDLENLTLAFPCVAEQTKIAKFLTALDDKINHATAELDAVKQYKQGLLQQMFV